MGKYDVLLQGNNSKEEVDFSKNKYASLLPKKSTSWKERFTGTPTKQYNGTYTANTGIIPVAKEVGRSLFQGTVGTGESLGQSISVNRGDFDALNKANEEKSTIKLNLVKKINDNKKLGRDNTALIKVYNSMSGPDDTIQTLAPATTKSKGQVLGELGLMAAGLLGAGTMSASAKGLGYVGGKVEQAALAKLTAKQLKNNLIKDVALNTGVGYGSDVSRNFADGKTGPGAFKPGLGTVAGFALPGLLGNANMNKILKQQSDARIASKYAQEFKIPDAVPGRFDSVKPAKITDAIYNPKEVTPKLDINIQPGARFITPEVKPSNPVELRATKAKTKQDFINNEVGFFTRTKQTPTPAIMKQMDNAWEKMHPKPVQETIPKTPRTNPINKGLNQADQPNIAPGQAEIPKYDAEGFRPVKEGEILPNGYTTKMNTQTGEQVTNAPFKDTPTQEIPKEQSFKNSVDEITQRAEQESTNSPLEVDSINLKAEGEKAKSYIGIFGKDKAKRVAMGIDSAPDGVKAGAIHSELTNQAIKEGDYVLAKDLATSDVFKPSAQEINLAKNREPNSFYWAVKDINDTLRKKRNIVSKMNEKSEINNIADKIRKSIEGVQLDNLSIKKLAASLICK
jgi:hypothetical protein